MIIGVVSALVIVIVIVIVIVRTYQSPLDEQAKSSQVEDSCKHTTTKPAPTIQRELRFRECGSLITDEKLPSSFGKLDAISTGDVSESDEKNPDIIPQQITGKSCTRNFFRLFFNS